MVIDNFNTIIKNPYIFSDFFSNKLYRNTHAHMPKLGLELDLTPFFLA